MQRLPRTGFDRLEWTAVDAVINRSHFAGGQTDVLLAIAVDGIGNRNGSTGALHHPATDCVMTGTRIERFVIVLGDQERLTRPRRQQGGSGVKLSGRQMRVDQIGRIVAKQPAECDARRYRPIAPESERLDFEHPPCRAASPNSRRL